VIISSFFSDGRGRPLSPRDAQRAVFLEIGGYDGYHASSTWYLERCLGWSGILVEADPLLFEHMRRNRPNTANLHVAACAAHTYVMLSGVRSKSRAVPLGQERNGSADRAAHTPTRLVPCGPLQDYLSLLHISRIDFFSLDVEGSEAAVLDSLNFSRLSVGVLLIEMRRARRRSELLRHGHMRTLLLNNSMRLVGQLVHQLPPRSNPGLGAANVTRLAELGVVDEVWVNVSHLHRFFPDSVALKSTL
jgi:FkbM family methyltransferase